MIKLVQIRKDNECLLSSKYFDGVLTYIDGLYTCHNAREKYTGVKDISCYYVDFFVDYQIDYGDRFDLQFSVKLNFKLSNSDVNRFLIDFVKPFRD